MNWRLHSAVRPCTWKLGTAARAALLLLGVLISVSPVEKANAQEVQVTGPLKGAPAVRHMRIYREGRFMIQPQIGFTLQDEYSRAILVGGQVAYHFTDWLGLGLWGGFSVVNIDTSLTDEVSQRGQTTTRNLVSLPSGENFDQQIAEIDWMGALQLNFIPLRGKLALFQEVFLDSDFHIFGGVAAVGLSERADVIGTECASQPDQCRNSQSERASRVALAPTFGAGLTFYATDFVGLSVEWRATPFAWNTSGTDEAGLNKKGERDSSGEFPDNVINSNDRLFHFNHMVSLGVVFYLPADIEVSQ